MTKAARILDGWMTTYTGRRFWPLHPDPSTVSIDDIAHHLAMACRYNGAVRRYYSVAEHSVLVSQFVPPELAVEALLHDASEAYMGDMIRPLKHQPEFALYREIESKVSDAVYSHFGIATTAESHAVIKRVDDRIILDETLALMPNPGDYAVHQEPGCREPLGCHIVPLGPEAAEVMFLLRWYELTA